MYNPLKDSLVRDKYAKLTLVFALAAVLLSTALPLNISSISIILFLTIGFSGLIKLKFYFNKSLILPVVIYFLMCLSLIWTTDFNATIIGIQKESLFLIFPLIFMFLPKISQERLYKIIRLYSFGMVIFAVFCFARATINYNERQTNDVFLFHNLVTVELNAIYIAAFSSLCLFYFIILKDKKPIDFFGLYIVAIFVVLLNSKTVFFIDLILFAWHYMFFSKTKLGVKSVTFVFIVTFFLLSVFFIKQVQDRIIEEYETAFVDNTIYNNTDQNQKTVKTISLERAWHAQNFETDSYFPGTAYRVFQTRIFKEIIQEKANLWLTGLGFNTSDENIKERHKKHGLFKDINYHNFHNQYVQFFAEIGILGFLAIVIMIFINIKNAVKNKDFLHIVFAFTMIILFLTESVLSRQRGIVFFITLYCLFNSVNYRLNSKQEI
jgi:hypothetical protein